MLARATLRPLLRHPDPPLSDGVITLRAKSRRDSVDTLHAVVRGPGDPALDAGAEPLHARGRAGWVAGFELELRRGGRSTGSRSTRTTTSRERRRAGIEDGGTARSATGSRPTRGPRGRHPRGASRQRLGAGRARAGGARDHRPRGQPRLRGVARAAGYVGQASSTCRRARGSPGPLRRAHSGVGGWGRRTACRASRRTREHSRVDDMGDVGLAIATSAPAARARSRAWRPSSTEITGSRVPWVIATGSPASPSSWRSKPGTVGMKPLIARRPAGLGRTGAERQRPGHHRPLGEAAGHGALDGTPVRSSSPFSHALSRSNVALNVSGSG